MKKRILSLLLCSFMLVNITSCNKKKNSDNNDSKPVATTTTAFSSTEPTTTVTTAPQPLLPPMTEPIGYFDGFKVDGAIRNVFNGTDNTLLIQCDNDGISTCYIFDPIKDEIIRSFEFASESIELLGMMSNGTIAAYENNTLDKIYMYPKNADKPNEITLDEGYIPSFKLDNKNDCIYWFNAVTEEIKKINESGNISTQVYRKDFNYIYNLLPDDLSFYACQPSEETKSGIEIGIYSITDNHLIAPITESYYESYLTKDNYITSYYEYNDQDCGSNLILQVSDINNNSPEKAYKIELTEYETYSIKSNPNSNNVILLYNNYKEGSNYTELLFFDPENGTIANSGIVYPDELIYMSYCYSESLERWIIATNPYEEGLVASSLLMMEPALLKYDRQLELAEPYQIEKQEIIEIGDNFKEIRKEADKIEKDFGIRLLIGDEVKSSESASQYIFTSTEKYNDEYYIQTEMENMRELRKILEMYPEDFFSHFKGTNGKCGLRISIVSELSSDSHEHFVASGLAYPNGGWYDIAICSSAIYETDSSLHHEIWHSVENLIEKRHGYIDATEWAKLNPENFEYSDDFDGFATGDSYDMANPTLDNTFYESEPRYDFPYFIYDYSMITPMEDRATLIERLLSMEYKDNNDYMQLIDINEIKKYHHLNAKIKYLEEWSKQEFGYVYWEKIHEKSRDVHYYN